MGKITICSQEKDYIKLKKLISGFTINNEIHSQFGFLSTYKKLRLETKNIYCEGSDFVAGVGTFIYKGKIDQDALRGIMYDYDDKLEFRKNIMGSYCIVTHKNNIINIFVDNSNTYNLYYFLDEEKNHFIATTTLFHLASCISNLIITQEGFVSYWFNHLLCEDTLCANIKRLKKDEVIQFDGNKWTKKNTTIAKEPIIGDLWEEVKKRYSVLPKIYRKFGVSMTGGQDSRLSLALLMYLGIQPTLYYGEGDSLVTCTKKRDREIVEEIAKANGLFYQTMNWRESEKKSESFERALAIYGEYALAYGYNVNIFNEFEKKIDTDFLAFGYFGEMFRAVEEIESLKSECFNLDYFIENMYINKDIKLFNDNKKIINNVKKHLTNICYKKRLNPSELRKGDYYILSTERRQRSDLEMNNYTNQFLYSFPLVGTAEIMDYANSIPHEEKLASKYQMKSIKELYPSLLEIPFFSHIKERRLDYNSLVLSDVHIASKLKDTIRKYIKNKNIMKYARKTYYRLIGDKKGINELNKNYKGKRTLITHFFESSHSQGFNFDEVMEALDNRMLEQFIMIDRMCKIIEKNNKVVKQSEKYS